MAFVFVRHTVGDYAKWKGVFDEHAAARAEYGSSGGYVLRNADNPNEVIVLTEFDTLDHAHGFAQSDSLREAMQRAGVISRPDVAFLEQADRHTR